MHKLLFIIGFSAITFYSNAQIFYSNGATIQINNGAVLFANGGVLLSGATQLNNEGELTTTINSTLAQLGDFQINTTAVVSGDGIYNIQQNWINNGTFNAGAGEVVLYGDLEQLITSSNGTPTTFNNLTLTGNGVGQDRRKTLLDVDASTGVQGILQINDRELYTENNSFTVQNEDPNAVLNLTTFNNEGFVSSIDNGFLIRNTNQMDAYIFPVGSSDGVRRYRPVEISPNTNLSQVYAVRMNNYSAMDDGYQLSQHESIIDEVNPLFYHSIENLFGDVQPDLKIYFVPSKDKDWGSIANWHNADQEWKDIGNTDKSNGNNFSAILKTDWNATDNNAYVLVNTSFPFKIPNVFTPNNDGENDLYFVTSTGLEDYNLLILNRWGNVVFETSDPEEGWDGTINGNPCSEGVYFYKLTAKQNNNEIKKHGFLTLVRNK